MKHVVEAFGIRINALRMSQAVEEILDHAWSRSVTCKYIVTPNVNHLVQLEKNAAFRQAYKGAWQVLLDSKILLWVFRILGQSISETCAGSDLVPALFAAVPREKTLRVYLLGAKPGVGRQAAESIEARWTNVKVLGAYSPPFGFETDATENDDVIARINEFEFDVLVIGLGAPKQELWIREHATKLKVPVAICAGATIDFLAGSVKRAPPWMRRLGMEWVHRILSEPKRLTKRYAHDAIVFPAMFLKEWCRVIGR